MRCKPYVAWCQEEGRQGGPYPEGESLFAHCLMRILTFCLPPNFRSNYHEGELEMGNSEFMYIWSQCTCCRNLRRKKNVDE